MINDLHHFARRIGAFLRRIPEPGPALDAEFAALAEELFRLQLQGNPAYRVWCQQAGKEGRDRSTHLHWNDLPSLPTAAFKELEVTAIPPEGRTTEFRSSGTTAQIPSRHFHHAASLDLYAASVRHGFRWRFNTLQLPRTLLSLTPPPEAAPHSSLAQMLGVLAGEFWPGRARFAGMVAPEGWIVDTTSVTQQIRAAREPLLLCGTAFNFVHLLNALGDCSPALLPPGSWIMETGGYKGRSRELERSDLHQALSEALGVPRHAIVTEYGMCELSSQAYTGEGSEEWPSGVLRFPPWARVLVISPETGREVAEGEAGLVRVIDLANVWSVLALQTNDLAIRRGDGLELLGRAPQAEARGCSLMSAEPR